MSKKSKQPQPSTVTILTIKHVARGELRPALTLAFASRDEAIHAVQLHLTNADEEITTTLRTLRVISHA